MLSDTLPKREMLLTKRAIRTTCAATRAEPRAPPLPPRTGNGVLVGAIHAAGAAAKRRGSSELLTTTKAVASTYAAVSPAVGEVPAAARFANSARVVTRLSVPP